MTTLSYEVDIKAPLTRVYQYSTDPENIKETWSPEIVTDSANISGTKGEKGSMFKITGHYGGKEEEMRMLVVERWPNNKFRAKQTEGPFKKWESIQEFQEREGVTHVKHTINYELPRLGRLVRIVSHSDADEKIRDTMEEYIQTLKYKMESSAK